MTTASHADVAGGQGTPSPGQTADVIRVERLTHRYGSRAALDDVSLSIRAGEIFGLLGPNGSGKTTLFRILSTLVKPQQGEVRLAGLDLRTSPDQVRRNIGVVFQSPSLDRQLTSRENLRHHGHLYGLRGATLEAQITKMLHVVGLEERSDELVGQFSGGMRRRVELAKGLLTGPAVLLLDEPSTGLDPAARLELWGHLRRVRDHQGVTILLTTHLMEEAEQCDRIGIMNQGKLAACDTPAALKGLVGADVITVSGSEAAQLAAAVRERFGVSVDVVDGRLRIERERGHELIPQLVEQFPGRIDSISLGKPTLEDVFVHVTGRTLVETAATA